MDYIEHIAAYHSPIEQEMEDRDVVLDFIAKNPNDVLLRENRLAHITSSGFIVNEQLNAVLMVHHNIRGVWGWTGGHADGEVDLLSVAIREAKEETGVVDIRPLSTYIAGIDILPVPGHYRHGRYISAHMHLSIAYLLICDDRQTLHVQPDENSAVGWVAMEDIKEPNFSAADVYVYHKLITRAKSMISCK